MTSLGPEVDLAQALFEHASDPCLVVRRSDAAILIANPLAETLAGYQRNELQGMSLEQLLEGKPETWRARLESSNRDPLSVCLLGSNGDSIPASLMVRPVGGREAPTCLLVLQPTLVPMARQSALRSLNHEMLSRTALLHAQAVEAAIVGVVITDATQRGNPVVYCNRSFETLTGYSRAEMLGRNCRLLQREDRDQPGVRALRRAVQDRRECRTVIRNFRKNGEPFWSEVSIAPILDEQGELTHFVGFQQDVTSRVETEANLRASEKSLARAHEIARLGNWELDAQTGVMTGSPEFHHILGLQPGDSLEPLEQVIEQLVHPEDRAGVQRAYKETMRTGIPTPIEFRISRTENGDERYVRGIGQQVHDAQGRLEKFVGTLQDITEQKQVEVALRESEALFRALSERSPAMVVILQDGNIKYANPALAAGTGYSVRTLQEMTIDQLFHPESRAAVAERTGRHQELNPVHLRYEAMILTRSGEQRWLDFSAETIDYQDRSAILGIGIDITKRKAAEESLDLKEAEIAHVARLSTLGEMVAGIAHEINQPLHAIVNFGGACSQILRDDKLQRELLLEWIGKIDVQAKRAAEIIRRLRGFSRKADAPWTTFDVNQLLKETVELVASSARRHRVTVQVEVDAADPQIRADRVQIQQVLVNLLRNAYEAQEGMPLDRRFTVARTSVAVGQVILEVEDHGPGLSASAEHIFDAFFTTKSDGMGIGLAISRTIMEGHESRLQVRANAHGGSTFWISLPLASAAPHGAVPAPKHRNLIPQSRQIPGDTR